MVMVHPSLSQTTAIAHVVLFPTIGRQPNGTHFVAEQRNLSGDRRQITWIFTGRLAPLRYENIGSNRK